MTISEIRRLNLLKLIEQYGSQAALVKDIDYSASQISQYVTRVRNIGEKVARKLESGLKKPAGWMDVSQERKSQKDYLVEEALSHASVGHSVEIRGWVPLISWVQAGDWHEAIDNFQPGEGDDQLPCPVPHSENTFALQVSGDSMADEYPEGYIIFVDPKVPPTHRSDVVVRMLPENEVTFKRYMIDGSKPYLKAMNKDWPNPIIPINGDADFCGVVIFAGKYPQRS